jgi:LacI family transcriptional regulator, repressor for deo operon, udp, cdd, tsx, nupC, and nupG
MLSAPKQIAATSVDVARRAGVSQSAVSLVLGGKATGRIGQKTQTAIRQAARDLGYRPNVAARTLRSGQSRLLVLAVPDIDNPYFAGALKGAEHEARNQGYSVALATVREGRDWQSVILDSLLSRSVEGFLLFALQPPTAREKRGLHGKAVLVDASSKGFPSIVLGVEDGIRSALAHLHQAGHTKIGHLGAAIDLETFNLRRETYLSTLREARLPICKTYQAQASFGIESATEAARKILSRPDRPSAIVCDSDVLAVGVYKAAKALGLAIPKDLCVVGIDDSIIARILDPELTTVAVPAGLIGQQAVRLLLDVLKGLDVPVRSTVPLSLVIRESTTTKSSQPAKTGPQGAT